MSIIDELGTKNIFFAVLILAIIIAIIKIFPNKPPEEKKEDPPCNVCGQSGRIIYFKQHDDIVKNEANYCPHCGRPVPPKPPEKK